MQPGPYQTFLISRTLQNGWQHTLPATFAPLLSDVTPVALALLLLTSLPAGAETLLYLVGGCFVLFLAYGAFRSLRSCHVNQAALADSRRQSFLKAVTLNFLNPNPYLFWSLVSGPLLVKGWEETPIHGVAFVTAFYATMVATCIAIILLFSGVNRLFPKVNRVLLGISVVALAAFGCYQLYLGVTSLWG